MFQQVFLMNMMMRANTIRGDVFQQVFPMNMIMRANTISGDVFIMRYSL